MAQAQQSTSITTGNPTLAEIGNNLPAAIGIANEKEIQNAARLQALFREMGTSIAESAARAESGVGLVNGKSALQIKEEQLGQLEAERRNQALAVEAGINPDMAIDIQAMMLRDIRESGMIMRDAARELQERGSVSLFDDPLQAIANAFIMPWTEQKLSTAATRQQTALETVTKINNTLLSSANVTNATKKTITEAAIASTQEGIAAQFAEQAAAIRRTGIQVNMQSIEAIMKSDERQFNLLKELDAWRNREETKKIQQAHLSISFANLKLAQENAARDAARDKATLEDKANDKRQQAQALELANKARAREGLAPYPYTDLSFLKYAPAADRAKFDMWQEKGLLLSDPITAATYTLGATPAEALKNAAALNIAPRNEAQRQYLKTLQDAAAVAAGLKPDARGKTQEEVVRNQIIQWQNYKSGDASNPIAPLSFSVLSQAPRIANTKVWQTVIAPALTKDTQDKPAEPTLVFPMLIAAVESGKIKASEAALFYKDLYTTSVKLSSESTDMYKWLRYTPDRIVASVPIGVNPNTALTADAIAASGLAMTASGVGAIPGAAVTAVGALGGLHARNNITVKVDSSDITQIQAAIVRSIAYKAGVLPQFEARPGYPTLENK